ncbi:acyltransferase family protein [Anatilimnocola floriformis]|uniref:acyltransferase family protein n=1 Tax=Anatilimnocola floriformis TaxID=2948575 RepID=UPI0020C565D6|nr:acyltransferase [Anatilimnocola floriformis]
MHERYLNTRTFGSLDGLRCLSILAVVFHHSTEGFESSLFAPFTRGDLGVQLFFVISGFLITTLLLRERRKCGDVDLTKFYIRRSLRIFPLYYVVLLLYLALVLVMGQLRPEKFAATRDLFLSNLPAFVTYTSDWFVLPYADLYRARGVGVVFVLSWSLAVEEQFYLVWPSIERIGWRWLSIVVAGLLIATDITVTWLRPAGVDPGPLVWIILRSISTAIICGVLLAHLLDSPKTYAFAYRWLGNPFALIAAAAAALAVPTFLNPDTAWYEPAAAVAFTLLLGTCVVREDNLVAPFLRWKPVAAIGTVSYSMYLLNLLVLDVVSPVLRKVGLDYLMIRFVVASAATVAAAFVTYYTIEAPFLRWKERFSRLGPSKPETAAAEKKPAEQLLPAD